MKELSLKAVTFLLIVSLALAALSTQLCVASNMKMIPGNNNCPMLSAFDNGTADSAIANTGLEPAIMAVFLAFIFVTGFQFMTVPGNLKIGKWLNFPTEKPPQSA